MRLIFGMILGVALTLGAVSFHDNNVLVTPTSRNLADRQIVNWDVLGAVVRERTAFVRRFWDDVDGS